MKNSPKIDTPIGEIPVGYHGATSQFAKFTSPPILLLLVLVSVLISEMAAYFIVDAWHFPFGLKTALLDAIVTIVFVFGALYFLVLRRMRTQAGRLQELEKALLQREADYLGIVEDQTVLICWINPQGEVSFFNKAITKYMTEPSVKILGESYLTWFLPRDIPSVKMMISQLTPDHPSDTGEFLQKTAAGDLRWFSWTIRAIYNPVGELIHYQAVGVDTTDYHCALEALKESRDELEQKVQQRTFELARVNRELRAEIKTRKKNEGLIKMQSAALEAAADGIMITDPEGIIQWGNPALADLSGFPLSELIGQTPAIFNSGFHSKVFYSNLWSTILSGGAWRGEIINRRRDKTLYVDEQTITPVVDRGGQVSSFIAIKHDITARKDAEEKESRRKWELQALNSVGTSFSPSLEFNWRFTDLEKLLVDELSVHSGEIYSYDPDLKRFDLETFWKVDAQDANAPISGPLNPRRVLEEKKPFFTTFSQPGRGEALCIPLISLGEVQGVIDLAIQGSKIGKDDRLDFFESLGYQIGVSFHNARLFKAEKKARQLAEMMWNVSLALSQTMDLNTILKILIESLEQLVPEADGIGISKLKDGLLHETASSGMSNHDRPEILDIHDFPLLREIVETQAARLVVDTRSEPLWRSNFFLPTTRCWLGVPFRVAGEITGICYLESENPGCFSQREVGITQALLAEAAIAIQKASYFEDVRAGNERLQALSRRLVEVQEMERRYIARELHDDTSQALIGLAFALEIIKRDADKPEAVASGVVEIDRIIGEILDNLHHLAVDLRPSALDHLGLIPAVRQYIDAINEKGAIFIQLDVQEQSQRLPGEIETALYRIIQEALVNVIRHANATRANVRIEIDEEQVRVFVSDNGVGFNVQDALSNGRLGLFGMRERAEIVGGSLTITSGPGVGTKISMEVPYDNEFIDRR